MVLIWKTGSKSETGNTILGKAHLKSRGSQKSVGSFARKHQVRLLVILLVMQMGRFTLEEKDCGADQEIFSARYCHYCIKIVCVIRCVFKIQVYLRKVEYWEKFFVNF